MLSIDALKNELADLHGEIVEASVAGQDVLQLCVVLDQASRALLSGDADTAAVLLRSRRPLPTEEVRVPRGQVLQLRVNVIESRKTKRL